MSTAEDEEQRIDLERLCQGVGPDDAACTNPASVHCTTCQRWFCDAHAEDEEWHSCTLQLRDEGGEA
jgi:hypothetical protein